MKFYLLGSVWVAVLGWIVIRRSWKKPLDLTDNQRKQLAWNGKLNWPIEWPPQTRYSGDEDGDAA